MPYKSLIKKILTISFATVCKFSHVNLGGR
ncbi:hypothetical protein VP191E371_P0025 [Vibrio phage 191E37-1]|nr:hypothetical protein VP191E371_P0025 [Vibrio phage 191E37-1]